MKGKQRAWSFFSHTSIIIGMMFIVFFAIDRFNPAMEFLTSNLSRWLILVLALCAIINGFYAAVFLFQKQKRQEEKRNHPQTRAAYENGHMSQQKFTQPVYDSRGYLLQKRNMNGYISTQGYPVPLQRNVDRPIYEHPQHPSGRIGPEHRYQDSYRR